jgi:hypothetical protein
MYRIGQRVQMVHGTETGVVVQSYPDGRLLVRFDDLLELDVRAGDIVALDRKAEQATRQAAAPAAAPKAALAGMPTGVYVVLDNPLPNRIDILLYNGQPQAIHFGVFRPNPVSGQAQGLLAGVCNANTQQILFSSSPDKLPIFSDLLVQWFSFGPTNFVLGPPMQADLKIRNRHLTQGRKLNPFLNRETAFLPLTPISPAISAKVDHPAGATHAAVEAGGDTPKHRLVTGHRPRVSAIAIQEMVVDLHIEKLQADHASLSNAEIMAIQIEAYEKGLDKAILQHLPSITFIHGLGKGTLKLELHKRLRAHTGVKGFSLDDSQKYGYGATLVRLA